jgi:hypothetical protein
MATKFDISTGKFIFHQPCKLWNVDCCNGCGYIHLLSSTRETRGKYSADSLLSSVSLNFDKGLMMSIALNELPVFIRRVFIVINFQRNKIIYVLAMAATKVCNYCDTPGFTIRGPGNGSVTLDGQVHHFMRTASSNNTQNCRLSYFIFDKKASCAHSSESENVNRVLLKIIVDGLKQET